MISSQELGKPKILRDMQSQRGSLLESLKKDITIIYLGERGGMTDEGFVIDLEEQPLVR